MADRGVRARLLRVVGRVRTMVPALQLARVDTGAMRAYLRHRPAVEASIGHDEAEAYAELIVHIALVDGDLARILATSVPDQLARVPAEHRATYFSELHNVLARRPEALPLVSRALPGIIGVMGPEALRNFVARGVELHVDSHHKAESFLRQESGSGKAAAKALSRGVALPDVSRMLTLYARAHCGEDVAVKAGQGRAFTDGHHVFLPEVVDQYGDARDFGVYRVMTAMGAAYLEFGTFDLSLMNIPGTWPDVREGEGELERFFRAFPNKSLARDLFGIVEDARVEARMRAEYPGVARDLDALGSPFRGDRPEPNGPAARAVEALARRSWGISPLAVDAVTALALSPLTEMLPNIVSADVHDVARSVARAYPAVDALMRRAEDGPPPESSGAGRRGPQGSEGSPPPQPLVPREAFEPPPLQPRLMPERAGPEERSLQDRARKLVDQLRELGQSASPLEARRQVREAEARAREAEARERQTTAFERMESVLDQQNAPGGALVDAARDEERALVGGAGLPPDPDAVPGDKTFAYREWDASIEDYKPGWVLVREQRLKEGSSAFVDGVMAREKHHIDALRRRFEALRPQGLNTVRGLTDGNDLDLDRLIEAKVAQRITGEAPDRVYMRTLPDRRDVSVAFLLDMSSSTNESAGTGTTRRIIDVEKEALIVVAEAINALGDPFAIYGFSGYGRDHVAFYVAKDFADAYDARARERIGRITFKMENRDGAAIRHATARLASQPARTRILILLSDGKPLDCGCDHYFDKYAQEDTRVALREARVAGVHPFCITVDPHGPAYLSRMYGGFAYTVIDRVELLPDKLLRIYRKLAL